MRFVSTFTTSSSAAVGTVVAGSVFADAGLRPCLDMLSPRSDGHVVTGRFGCGRDSEYVSGLSLAVGAGVGAGSIFRPDWAISEPAVMKVRKISAKIFIFQRLPLR